MEKNLSKNIFKSIEKYGILDELAYNEGGYVIVPTNSKIDMASIRAIRKLSKNTKKQSSLVTENSDAIYK